MARKIRADCADVAESTTVLDRGTRDLKANPSRPTMPHELCWGYWLIGRGNGGHMHRTAVAAMPGKKLTAHMQTQDAPRDFPQAEQTAQCANGPK